MSTNSGDNLPASEDGVLLLGQQLQNPYLVSNMTMAYNQLRTQGVPSLYPVDVRATHYYVKFKPENFWQYDVLANDENLDLYEYPLDYSIAKTGDRYHDPSLPDSVPTYQYAAVPVNFQFNDTIPYDIIDPLYIPEEDEKLLGDADQNESYVDRLLDEAYILTGNFDDTLGAGGRKGLNRGIKPQEGARFTPGGRIRVFDTRLNSLIGLEGIRVRARRWFTVRKASPDFNGNYRMAKSFKRKCNYSLWFATSRFRVHEHYFGTTKWVHGPKQKGDWNLDMEDGYRRFASHVFRGAYRYTFGDIDGLERPNTGSGKRLLLVAVNDALSAGSGISWVIIPHIRIGRFGGGAEGNGEYASDEVFSTTCHEITHTTHSERWGGLGAVQYAQVERRIQESWAVAVEWWLTGLEYRGRGIADYGTETYAVEVQYPNQFAFQYWRPNISATYTTLFINLIDDFNEVGVNFTGRTAIVNDQVTDYTIAGIEQDILPDSYGLFSLNAALKNHRPAGVTDAAIDNLLSFY